MVRSYSSTLVSCPRAENRVRCPGRNLTMRLRGFFVTCITVLAVAGTVSGASAQRAASPDRDLIVAQRQQQPSTEPGDIFRDCDDCEELVVVPSGDFIMGSNDAPYEKPERTISIPRPFAIGRREVTFAEWDQCADAGACKHRPDDHNWGRGNQPVINVSWDDA